MRELELEPRELESILESDERDDPDIPDEPEELDEPDEPDEPDAERELPLTFEPLAMFPE